MAEDKIYKSDTIVPAINRPDQEALDSIAYGLENTKDEHEKAELHNTNVMNNTKDRESQHWPNAKFTLEMAMAQGLEAIEKLGSSDYSVISEKPNDSNTK